MKCVKNLKKESKKDAPQDSLYVKSLYPYISALPNRLRNDRAVSVSLRIFAVKVVTLSLPIFIIGVCILDPAILGPVAQVVLMTMFQIPLHEFAHYVVAKRFFFANETSEIGNSQRLSATAKSEFTKKYLTPRFGLNSFYGIRLLKIVPAIFLQELVYTGKQFALIALAGPIVDLSFSAIYITVALLLGPLTLMGFFSTEIMLYFAVVTILTSVGSYMAKKLDLGKFRRSIIKRNAYNRFLMGLFYLDQAALDERGQLILDNQPGQRVGVTRLYYLFNKLKDGTASNIEFDLLVEAVIAANHPIAKLARTGELLQRLNNREVLKNSQLTGLEGEIRNVEKALAVHLSIAHMNNPVYFGLDFVGKGYNIGISTFEVRHLLDQIKALLGITYEVPYFVAGGRLILIIERDQTEAQMVVSLQASQEFGSFVQVRRTHQERQAFKGRTTIKVGVAEMQAPEGIDYSRELAHAEVLWDMITDSHKGHEEFKK